jgi:hypothetical protein
VVDVVTFTIEDERLVADVRYDGIINNRAIEYHPQLVVKNL